MHDRRSIRTAHEQGAAIRGIARNIGASRNAVRRALHPDARLDYSRPSMADEYAPAVRDVLADYPRIAVSQVAEIVEWPGARRTLSDLVGKLRPAALEREREDLTRPQLGTVTAGRILVGKLTIGALTLGRAI